MSNGELIIPESWAIAKLSDVLNVKRGGSPRPVGDPRYFGGGAYGWLRISDVTSQGKFIYKTKDSLTEAGKNKSVLVMPGEIVLSNSATIGIPAIVQFPLCIHDGFLTFKNIPSQISINYLYEFFRYSKTVFEKKAVKGTTQANLNIQIVSGVQIVIPPEKEQTRIVEKIESCFSKIEKTEKALLEAEDLLSKYRESLLAKAFRGELIPQDPNDEPASELLKKIKAEQEKNGKGKKNKDELPPISEDEIPFEIPKSWKWVRIGSLCSKIGSGKTPKGGNDTYVNSGVPLIRSQNVLNNSLYLDNVAFIKESVHQTMKNTAVLPRDVLLNITGGSIGRSCVVPDDFIEGNVNQHVCIIRSSIDDIYLSQYISSYILSIYGQKLVRDNMKGAARDAINMEQINNFLIPLPPKNELKRVANKIFETLNSLKQTKNKIRTGFQIASKMKESILNNAFQGKLVPQISEEGTGHELLEQILKEKEQETESSKKPKNKVSKKTTTPKTKKKTRE